MSKHYILDKQAVIDALQDKKVICWGDLLIKLGLVDKFKAYKETHGKLYQVHQMYMGKTLINWVDEILRARIIKSRDKRVRACTKVWKLYEYDMDALYCRPALSKKDIDYLECRDLND